MHPLGRPDGELRIVTSPIAFLASKSGRRYLGCDIPADFVEAFVRQMAAEEPADFEALRTNQSIRDQCRFHVTAISPPEFETVGGQVPKEVLGKAVTLTLSGLGKAVRNGQRSFFVVVECEEISNLRHDVGLGCRDLHITLGFDGGDVHGISKGHSTLI